VKAALSGLRTLIIGDHQNIELLKELQTVQCIKFESGAVYGLEEHNTLGNTMPFHLYQECGTNSHTSSTSGRDLIAALRKIKETALDLSHIA
jgi:hypothetical protein